MGLVPALWQTSSDLLGRLGGTPLGPLPPVVFCCTWVNMAGDSVHKAFRWSTDFGGPWAGMWNVERRLPPVHVSDLPCPMEHNRVSVKPCLSPLNTFSL